MQLNSAVIGENIARKNVQKHSPTICWGHSLESTFTPAPLGGWHEQEQSSHPVRAFPPALHEHGHTPLFSIFQRRCLQLPLPSEEQAAGRLKQGSSMCVQEERKALACQEARAPGAELLPVSWLGSHTLQSPAGPQGSSRLSSPLGANQPAIMAWLLPYTHARQLGDHFSHTPWQFGAGTERGQLAATRSPAALPWRSCRCRTLRSPGSEKQSPALRC